MLGVLVLILGTGLLMTVKGDLVKDNFETSTNFGDAEDYCLTKVSLKFTKKIT